MFGWTAVCQGDKRPCADVWRLPVCCMLTSLNPISGLSFPPKLCQWAQLELFISWCMGLNNPWRGGESEGVLVQSANAPISNPPLKLITPAPLLWTVEKLLVLNQIHACHNKSRGDCSLGAVQARASASAAGKWGGLVLSPGSVCTIPKPSGHNGRGVNQIIIALTKSYIFRS